MITLVPNGGIHSSDAVRRVIASAVLIACLVAFCATTTSAQNPSPSQGADRFPDTATLISQVAQDQKKVESLLSQYTFTDKSTAYKLDKDGKVISQHTDVYYITPNAHEFFVLHVSHDGVPVAQQDLDEQLRKIEKQMQDDERRAQKNQVIHPKDELLFADIIAQSKFTPLRWDEVNGLHTVVYDFQPKSASRSSGSLTERIAGDLKGTMWISPEEKEVVRIAFSSVSSLNFGMGFLGNVKGFQGTMEQKKFHGQLWMPARQEYVANGRELFTGFRIRQVDEFSDYLKATTDVLQQIHPPKTASAGPEPR